MKNVINYIPLMALVLVVSSCRKDSNVLIDTSVEPQNQTFEETNFNGVVYDVNGLVIEDAEVKIGDNVAYTDQNGYFKLSGIANTKGASLKVTKDGYFHGLGNLSLNQSQDNFFKIALQERVLTATINSIDGGAIVYGDHKVALASNAFVLESGEAYSGEVEVYMAYIDPTANNFSELIPGNMLVGDETRQETEILKSYGMLHVELTTPQGDPLQINEDATLEMSIPTEMEANAPDAIPLWYFDEDNGLWREDGEAIKTNGKYVGQVSHFTLWNCDDVFNAVELKGQLFSRTSLKNIKIGVWSEFLGQTVSTSTNSMGEFGGLVPPNDNLVITIYNSCNEVVFTQTVQSNDECAEVDIFVNVEEFDLVTLSGYVTDCEGNQLPNAYVMINDGSPLGTLVYQADNTGYMQTDLFKCTDQLIVTVVDFATNLQGSATYDVDTDVINIGNLEACADEIVSKIVFEYNEIIESHYLVTFSDIGSADEEYHFRYQVSFDDGSSYIAVLKLRYNGPNDPGIWETRVSYEDIIGSPATAYNIRILNNVNFLADTDDYFEVEFPIARIHDSANNSTLLTEEGRVYIKAVK